MKQLSNGLTLCLSVIWPSISESSPTTYTGLQHRNSIRFKCQLNLETSGNQQVKELVGFSGLNQHLTLFQLLGWTLLGETAEVFKLASPQKSKIVEFNRG